MDGKKLLLLPALLLVLIVCSAFTVPQVHATSTQPHTHIAPALTFPDPVCHPADVQYSVNSGITRCYIGYGYVSVYDRVFALYAGSYNGYIVGYFGTYYFCAGEVLTNGYLNDDYMSQLYMTQSPVSWC